MLGTACMHECDPHPTMPCFNALHAGSGGPGLDAGHGPGAASPAHPTALWGCGAQSGCSRGYGGDGGTGESTGWDCFSVFSKRDTDRSAQDVKLDNILLCRRPDEGGGEHRKGGGRRCRLEPRLADFGLHVVRGLGCPHLCGFSLHVVRELTKHVLGVIRLPPSTCCRCLTMEDSPC